LRTPLTQNNVKPTAGDWLQKGFRAAIFAGLMVFVLALFGFTATGDSLQGVPLPLAVGAVAWISFMLFAPHDTQNASIEVNIRVEAHPANEQEMALSTDVPHQRIDEQPDAADVARIRRGTGHIINNPRREWTMIVRDS